MLISFHQFPAPLHQVVQLAGVVQLANVVQLVLSL